MSLLYYICLYYDISFFVLSIYWSQEKGHVYSSAPKRCKGILWGGKTNAGVKGNQFKVQFVDVNSIIRFVEILDNAAVRADLVGGQSKLSATSLLGLMSTDLSASYDLVLPEDTDDAEKVSDLLHDYIIQ